MSFLTKITHRVNKDDYPILFLIILTNTPTGYESTEAQLLSVPPYAVAAILTVSIGYLADRTRQRGLCNIAVSFIGITGFGMLLGSSLPGVQYVGTFLGAMGIYPAIANTISWASNNTEGLCFIYPCLMISTASIESVTLELTVAASNTGVYKRGVTLGFVIGWGNLNGIVASNIYRDEDKPRYLPGHGTVLAYLVLFQLGGSVAQYLLLRRENAQRRSGRRDSWTRNLSPEEIDLLGDKRPDFLYTL